MNTRYDNDFRLQNRNHEERFKFEATCSRLITSSSTNATIVMFKAIKCKI